MQRVKLQGFPLSPQQRRLWSLIDDNGAEVFRCECAALIEGNIGQEALNRSLQSVIKRNEILRTSFRCLPGLTIPLQVIENESALSISFHDARDLSDLRQQERVDELFNDSGCARFNLESGPVAHFSVEQLSPARQLLFISLPALCSDARSVQNLAQEIAQALAEGNDPQQPAPDTLQYADLSGWQNELFESDESATGKRYWTGVEAGALAGFALPFERRPKKTRSFNPEKLSLSLDQTTAGRIAHLADGYGVSVSTFLLTCLYVSMFRLTRRSELIAGALFDGRNYAELEDALGPFAKYLPIEIRIDGAARFEELLMQVRDTCDEATKWQECFAWDQWQESRGVASPVDYFPVCFEHGQRPEPISSAGFSFNIIKQYSCVDRFKLKVASVTHDRGLDLEFHYAPNFFALDDVRLFAQQHMALVEHVAQNPHAVIADLFYVTTATDLEQFSKTLSNRPGEEPNRPTVHEMIARQAQEVPDRVALICEDHYMTYAEFVRRADKLALYLRTLGVSREALVGIYLNRSVELFVGLLAVLKAGGAYVPLDTGLPKERLAYMLEDAQPRAVLTLGKFSAQLEDCRARLVYLDEDWPEAEDPAPCAGLESVLPENLAYLLYTSGSTGKPKGVAIEHRQLAAYISGIAERLDLPQEASYVTLSTFAADLGNTAIFPALCGGGSLHVIAQEIAEDSLKLAEYFASHPIDCMKVVPSHLDALQGPSKLEVVMPVSRLVLGGELCRWELIDRFKALAPDCVILNHYGPTEATVGVLSYRVEPEAGEPAYRSVPLGTPIANAEVLILDPNMRPAPPWVPAELLIGGQSLARGYFNRPDLTAERFAPNPFNGATGSRLYKTGDLARYHPAGLIEFIGRIDNQVKIRGFRVELGEVEAAIKEHAGVKEAVVKVLEDPSGNNRLAAYVVPVQSKGSTMNVRRLHKMPNEMKVAYVNDAEVDFLYKEIFEDEAYLRHGLSLRDGDCVFDVGANIGMFTLFAKSKRRNLKIFAFEPIPPVFEALRANVELYGLDVHIEMCGISKEAGTARFVFNPVISVISGMYVKDEEWGGVEKFDCRLKSISQVIDEHKIARIDLLKIDVEKSEMGAVEGIREEHWPLIKQVVIEVHDIDGRIDYVVSLLERHGFQASKWQQSGVEYQRVYNIYATHPSRGESLAPLDAALPGHQPPALAPVSISIWELRRSLEEKLPAYMLPAEYMLLESFPLTPGGKIDRRALPEPKAGAESETVYVGPQDEVERNLVEIWEQVLGVSPIGIRDRFFDLGGHSLLALRLMARINNSFGRNIPLTRLLEAGTIELLAGDLREGANSLAESPLVALQPQGSKPPLFFIHPVTGNAFCYANLARSLGKDQPFFGLQAQITETSMGIEEMASFYINAIRQVQPQGPYFIGGWSLGGTIAYEMSRLLQSKGEKVALLAILDRLAFGQQEEASDEATLQAAFAETIATVAAQMRLEHSEVPELSAQSRERLFKIFKQNYTAQRQYAPSPSLGRVTLFRAEESIQDYPDATGGWSKLAAGGVEIYDVPGSHGTMLIEPQVVSLSERLKTCLEKAEKEAGSYLP